MEKSDEMKIKIVGVGGCGCNYVDSMIEKKYLSEDEFIAIDTYEHSLESSPAKYKIQIGAKVVQGLGAGANPNKGKKAAEEDRDKIYNALEGSNIVFILAGLGGGTGTGASPVIAEISKEIGAVTIAFVTKPFSYEGLKRKNSAESAIKNLSERVDAIKTISNDSLLEVCNCDATLVEAFSLLGKYWIEGINKISDHIVNSGNIKPEEVEAIMRNVGTDFGL